MVINFNDISLTRGKINGREAVMQSLKNLFETKKGSIPHNRDFGVSFEQYLFDLETIVVKKIVEKDILFVFSKYLSPLRPESINISFSNNDNGVAMSVIINIVIDGVMETLNIDKLYTNIKG